MRTILTSSVHIVLLVVLVVDHRALKDLIKKRLSLGWRSKALLRSQNDTGNL